MAKSNKMYFGSFSGYEEYYAIGKNPEEVKQLLWRMYANNFYGKPTKEDRRVFDDEVSVEEIAAVELFGYNTAYKESYTLRNNRLKRIEGEVVE